MHRFFVPPECIQKESVCLEGPLLHQVAHVLRLRPGEQFVVLDGTGTEYLVRLAALEAKAGYATVVEARQATGEPRCTVTLYQGLLKGEKFEWVLQKGTEVGVSTFVPLLCGRAVPRGQGEGGWGGSRTGRWRRILQEAAEQSGRGRIPTLEQPFPFAEACRQAQPLALIAWEQERTVGLRAALRQRLTEGGPPSQVSLFIGPEGGFTPEEVALAAEHGITAVSLGTRVLRAETAGPLAAALVLYELGEMGG